MQSKEIIELMPPKVSIILPNLNHRKFLDERIRTIQEQTFTDWECIVIDGYSNDGSWELFKKIGEEDKRFKIYQTSRNGIYDAFNRGIDKAIGDYVYIATSDDTMRSDCLQKMVFELDEHSNCDICHCQLSHINQSGEVLQELTNTEIEFLNVVEPSLMNKKHIRKAPIDGLIHMSLITVYRSITQLLIRKKLFYKVGFFRRDWGSQGDFEWELRASLVSNIVFIPERLATWRLYEGQATSTTKDKQKFKNLYIMVCEAIKIIEKDTKLYSIVNNNLVFVKGCLDRLLLREFISKGNSKLSIYLLCMIYFFKAPTVCCALFIYYFKKKIARNSAGDYIRREETIQHLLNNYDFNEYIEIL